ncbi:PepSY domain-containing protein [Aquimarina sp. D1M17]|uniref:PepSY domain-containing protein n=1 Tax=Aquimarina acroporae TaxID=2937283 RepID=UPI0020BE87C2|nr:PepSY domain-containing protein [Aquimarina acroporae]MCK8520143.1 PepSY domain-containing protein [Aquimarina acroporae]
MTISIWRYSHLALAISSSLFLCIAAITGIILAFEPISEAIYSHASKDNTHLSLAETIDTLTDRYVEVIDFEIDPNGALLGSVITKAGDSETIYIDPITGEKLGVPREKAAIFKFATNLHRSLFLKSTGRFFVGFISFLLIIIAITGIVLIAKRQGGIKRFFAKIEKEYFTQYYHVILGRLFLIPILIVAVTGVYLSLERFSLLPKVKISHQFDDKSFESDPKIDFANFEVFKAIQLKDVRSVEFPFSDDVEDYFLLKLSDKELIINQFNGAVISEQQYPFIAFASMWSSTLHTGKGSIFWSLVLLISSCSIVFFMYSGFTITLKRRKSLSSKTSYYDKDEAEFIVLVGSESGSTFKFANLFANALSSIGKKVFVSELNMYEQYSKAQHLIIFSATYGVGEPPTNAKKFESLFSKSAPTNPLQYAIVGFGSLAYPDFCQYALDIDRLLETNSKLERLLEPYKINNQSFTAFKDWISLWSKKTGIDLKIKTPIVSKKPKEHPFTVVNRSAINIDDTFLLQLRPKRTANFESGDLLSFYPKEDKVERLYSIAKIDGDILLAIKKHEFGICSNYFSTLEIGDVIDASIQPNSDFHFPSSEKEVILISNGTGIGPFLGMMLTDKNIAKTHLFWGGRTKTSLELYDSILTKGILDQKILSLHLAYSQEGEEKTYVQDLVKKEVELISRVLVNQGTIMICGSIAMQKDVIAVLETLSETKLSVPLSNFQQNNQIKMDCY